MAHRGAHLVIAARNREGLQKVAAEIRDKHGVNRNIEIVVMDLADPESPRRLLDHLQKAKIHADVLVNNAGFGHWGNFEEEPYEKSFQMNMVNMVNLSSMCHLFIPLMLEKGGGGIINVASSAGFQPVPYMANYAATKAFVLHLSLALWQEYLGRGVTITALCPGWTRTGFLETAGIQKGKTRNMIEPDQVVNEALDAFLKGEPLIIPKAHRDLLQFTIARFIPLKSKLDITAAMFRPEPGDGQKKNPEPVEKEPEV
jgi:short-subunit dehydrogenase